MESLSLGLQGNTQHRAGSRGAKGFMVRDNAARSHVGSRGFSYPAMAPTCPALISRLFITQCRYGAACGALSPALPAWLPPLLPHSALCSHDGEQDGSCAILCRVMQCHAMPCHTMMSHAVQCHVVPCHGDTLYETRACKHTEASTSCLHWNKEWWKGGKVFSKACSAHSGDH